MIKVLFENLSIKAFKQTSEEYTAGQITTVTADFRKYGCIEDSVADHSAYLNGAKNGSKLRYEGLKGCTDYKKAIQIIKDSISQAITWANEQRNQAGDPVRGARYGYRKDKKPVEGIHHWHINEEEAVRVRMAYKLCEEGKAFAAIARELNAFEAEHGATRKWSPQSVKRQRTLWPSERLWFMPMAGLR